MNTASGPEAQTCSGCGSALVTNARFCAHCGLPADAVDPEPIALVDGGPGSSSLAGRTTSTTGRGRRDGVPEWLAVVAGVAAVLSIWFVISRPSGGTEVTGASFPGVEESADEVGTETEAVDEPSGSDQFATTVPATTRSTSASAPANGDVLAPPDGDDAPDPTAGGASMPPAHLGFDGWRLLVGDGLDIVEVDLDTAVQTRHDEVGAPLDVVDDRLLLYRDTRLVWSSVDDLDQPTTEIAELPTLQRMLTRGRPADRPVVVGDGPDAAIWWPNNNADPQTWSKVRLADGVVVDSIALTDTVYGGPEVVATVGSGTFERVDGAWVAVGDLFASSASPQAIIGQRCDGPDICQWVLQRRGASSAAAERLDIPVGGPFDVRLVTDADRILLLQGGGVTDYRTGRFVPIPVVGAATVTAVNRSSLLAVADGSNVELGSSRVTIVDLDGPPDRSAGHLDGPPDRSSGRIAIDDLIPRWMVLVPPVDG